VGGAAHCEMAVATRHRAVSSSAVALTCKVLLFVDMSLAFEGASRTSSSTVSHESAYHGIMGAFLLLADSPLRRLKRLMFALPFEDPAVNRQSYLNILPSLTDPAFFILAVLDGIVSSTRVVDRVGGCSGDKASHQATG
jgi:hypothetical protein